MRTETYLKKIEEFHGNQEEPVIKTTTDGPVSIPNQIADRLATSIVNGELKPGEKITENQLAADFSVSRGPVREALHVLHKEGLIEILPRRGARVAYLSYREIEDLYEVRAELFAMASRKAAENNTDFPFKLAEEGVVLLDQLAKQGVRKKKEFLEVRGGVGGLVLASAGNARLASVISLLNRQALTHQEGFLRAERMKQAVSTWRDLMRAIKKQDSEAASAAGRKLVIETRDELLKRFDAKDKSRPSREVA